MGVLKWRYWIAVVLYCVAIFWLSHQSEPPMPTEAIFSFSGADKVGHGILYAGLAVIVSVGVRRSNSSASFRLQWFVPVVFVILYGLSDEVHQLYVPKRSFDWYDLLADGVGAALAQIGLALLWRKRDEIG